MKHGPMPTAAAGALALLLLACGTPPGGSGGDTGDGGGDATDNGPSPTSGPPQATYQVESGDTLNRIARRECGDRAAAISIFDTNRGRLQRDGKALVDPDRIVVGWTLVLDCSGADSAASFTPAATEPTPVPENPGDAFPAQAVPQNTVRLLAPAGPVEEGGCLGRTAMYVRVDDWTIRADAAAETIELHHGDGRFVHTEGFGDAEPEVALVDAAGRRRTLGGTSLGFDLYADPEIPPGDYVLEVTAGGRSGQGGVRITPASRLDLVRTSFTDLRYDIVGGTGSLPLIIYRRAAGECDEDTAPWQEPEPLSLSGGVGRLTISTADAAPGTYCLAIRGEGSPAAQCFDAKRLFLVR
jgi:hypothetical protein